MVYGSWLMAVGPPHVVVGRSAAFAYHRRVVVFPEPYPGEPLTVSATLHRTYIMCPQQALGRLLGEYPKETVASFKGSLAHRLFARHLVKGPIGEDDVAGVCREEIGAGLNAKLSSIGINKPSQLAPVLSEVGDLYQRFRKFPTDGFRSAEVALESEPVAGVTLRGSVDAVFDDPDYGTRLIDWKTGTHLDDAPVQLAFYAMAWAFEKGDVPGRAEAVSVKTGERITIEPSPSSAAETAAQVADMVGELRKTFESGEDLERTAGPHCAWCPLLDDCSEGAAAVKVTRS